MTRLIYRVVGRDGSPSRPLFHTGAARWATAPRSEEHTSELQSHLNLVCRLLLDKNKRRSGRTSLPLHLPPSSGTGSVGLSSASFRPSAPTRPLRSRSRPTPATHHLLLARDPHTA